MKKKIKIAIIISIIVIIILAGTVLCIYFFTDTFKSEKQLFLEYISKSAEEMQFFKDEDLSQYKEKQKNTPYTNNGEIKMKFIPESESLESKELLVAQNCNISLQGSKDFANNYFYQNVKVNYSDTENLDINFFNNQDLYGAKISNILKKYLTVENNNLKEWMEQLGLDEETIAKIPDKIEFKKNEEDKILTDEEIKTLKEKYLNIITQSLTDDMFSKEEASENTVFTLKINEEQLKNILLNLLQAVKDDEMIINIIKREAEILGESSNFQMSDFEDDLKSEIQDLIDNLNETELTDIIQSEEIIFNIYVENKNIAKIELVNGIDKISILKINNGLELIFEENEVQKFDLKVEKIKENDELTYKVNCMANSEEFEEQGINLSLDIDYKGITTLEKVQETCTFKDGSIIPKLYGIDENVEMQAIYTNTKQFNTNITQEQIGEKDIMLLNGKDSEKLQSIFEQAGSMLEKVNEKQMRKIDLYTNPMMYYIPAVIPTSVMMICNSQDISITQGFSETSMLLILTGASVYSTYGITNRARDARDLSEQMQREEAERLEQLEEETDQFDGNYQSEETNEIDETDEVEEKSETEKQFLAQTFNARFEEYEGDNVEFSYLNDLMMAIKNSNLGNEDHYIEVESNIGEEIDDNEYRFSEEDGNAKVSMEYDEDGYINKIIIEGI